MSFSKPACRQQEGKRCCVFFFLKNLKNRCEWIAFPQEAKSISENFTGCLLLASSTARLKSRWVGGHPDNTAPAENELALHFRFPCQSLFLFNTFIWPTHGFFSPRFKTEIKYISLIMSHSKERLQWGDC